ncbi:AbrB/MazE/SpoVT family DNA-binding domain-containing protein [Brevundimonas fontaquae]|uniref:AbrB/MazE/SpoVT family DNA-binding domain-containing protein n=1 Tax=Brevundimonas fontaquae TaxID=2813778 RepID=A0ABX7LMU6_9CAUL|nr:AbrB/MazE/SpoVT family DNA-binding domain-containing protein [Brevundimonas fontaquae]QSF54136.1 AbrB/MazE/SpoVT family DNA-binding domain-containing protein [Brevundimonas fontaquae]
MIKSRLTSKAQTTIPQAVRAALSLQDGDELQYDLDGDRVILRKVRRAPVEDPFAAFDEWDSDADRKAYAGL